MVNDTLEVPVPVDGPVSVIHDVFDAAVHVHVEAEGVTVISLWPPENGIDPIVADSVNVHDPGGGGAGVCAAA